MARVIQVVALLLCLMSLVLPQTLLAAPPAQDVCSGNILANPGFEEGSRRTLGEGTSLSSWVANGWYAWSLLGDQSHNREPEFKVEDIIEKNSAYRAHSGQFSQKFFTLWATHTSGFWQRVQVPKGSLVTFSIWVQVYSGEHEIYGMDNRFISDLGPGGPGYYAASAGIDPYGDTPPGLGAPPSTNVVWSASVNEFDTRRTDANGNAYDAWVQLTVSARALSDYVTVFTRGAPLYAVKHNDSFWDDACLTYVPPTPTPTNMPKPTATPTDTPIPTDTPVPTDTPLPTDTPTFTPEPTATDTPMPTDTPTVPPTATEAATATAVQTTVTAAQVDTSPGGLDAGLVVGAAIAVVLIGGVGLGFWLGRRRA